ncbi:succinate dehydrogenase assembly factor 2 family protein [Marinobacter halodurans]|uniref:FAD assembly factor SdhE n=1 Tax=Marinobacter halodurans TaxID=2528979 RepID=A0ABY1ZN24_9GAMM|nr:succinate dehydrogenase assembly factor 2 [Marinobacter halodurans]TBW57853.1 succinate dehydrogenase assembly factor 2 family protein [Marinobacter halodurans]
MDRDVEFKRLYWHSRRGMLELDVLLIPFLEEVYPGLPPADKARYQKLIDCEDTQIYQWFMQRERPEDPDLQVIVDMILDRVQPD